MVEDDSRRVQLFKQLLVDLFLLVFGLYDWDHGRLDLVGLLEATVRRGTECFGCRFGEILEHMSRQNHSLDGFGLIVIVVLEDVLGPIHAHLGLGLLLVRLLLQLGHLVLQLLDHLALLLQLLLQLLTGLLQLVYDGHLLPVRLLLLLELPLQLPHNVFEILKHLLVLACELLEVLELFEKVLVLGFEFLVLFLLESVLHLESELIVHLLDGVDERLGESAGRKGTLPESNFGV